MSKRMADMSKEDKIKREIKRLKKIFSNLTQDASDVAERLIENAAFLAELQALINLHGYTEEYQNGESQKGVKKSSEVDIYNTMIKNFNVTMKQLIDMLPDSPSGGNSRNAALDYITGCGAR